MTADLIKLENLETQFVEIADTYLNQRSVTNNAFRAKFHKVTSDMVCSQNADGLEKIKKSYPQSFWNAIFRATESGASFAKKEIYVLPFEIYNTTKVGDVTKKAATGMYDLTIIIDINFQKQQILKMPNCKKFFPAEVHEGVTVIHDLTTGNRIFEGINDVTKPTIGYYAAFLTTDGELYDEFMTCAEIVERAKLNEKGYKEKNYINTKNSPHYEKIVIRNLIKGIPNLTEELQSISTIEDVDYEDLTDKVNALPEAKKSLEEIKKELTSPKTSASNFLNSGVEPEVIAGVEAYEADTNEYL